MSDAIEVLKKDIISYEEIRKSGKKCLTTNNEECCFVHYPEIKEALLALEQKATVDRFVVEVFNRLKERAEFDRARAETDLKILEKWKKNYKELVK